MKRHRILLLLLIALVVFLCIALISSFRLAYEPLMSPIMFSLSCGQSIYEPTAEINEELQWPGANCRYIIVLENSSLITARLTGLNGDMDPVLTLIDEAGNILIEDDDSGGNRDALIEGFLVEQPGSYTIVVSSYGDEGAGPFELLVEIQGNE